MSTVDGHRRPFWVDLTLLILAGAAFVAMLALGNWQMDRLAWKRDLIAQVDSRAFGDAIPATSDVIMPEYQRVKITGSYQHEASLRVKAVTELGPGQWTLTPLMADQGIVWVNRGFVPTGEPASTSLEPDGLQDITGLVRHTQPDGSLLERNNPSLGRWVSVDVTAMSKAAGMEPAFPYYIAADHVGEPSGWPRGGLTKVEFRNSHLSYALTWYAMAALFAGAMAFVVWDRRR